MGQNALSGAFGLNLCMFQAQATLTFQMISLQEQRCLSGGLSSVQYGPGYVFAFTADPSSIFPG